MCFGTAHIIDDPQEKSRALNRMIDRFYPGRAATLRTGTALELKATTLIGKTIDQASGKIRSKGVGDEEEDYALPIYAAKFPVRTVIVEVETCPRMPGGVPRPPGLAPFTPGRRLDDIILETRNTSGLP
jgi:hypothetical protein